MKTFLATLLTVVTFCSSALAYDLIIDFPGRYELDLNKTYGPYARIMIRPEYRPNGHVWVTPSQQLYCEVLFYDNLYPYDQMTIYWQSYKAKRDEPDAKCELNWWTSTGWNINLLLKK